MSNYYHDMTQLINTTHDAQTLDFYRENVQHIKDTEKISQKEYLMLLSMLSEKAIPLTASVAQASKFEIGDTYSTRSICDHDCIFEIKVISRTDKMLTYDYSSDTRRSKIKIDADGNEYITPDNYSMAPTFRANKRTA